MTRTAPPLTREKYTSHIASGSQTIVVEDLSEASANVTMASWEARLVWHSFNFHKDASSSVNFRVAVQEADMANLDHLWTTKECSFAEAWKDFYKEAQDLRARLATVRHYVFSNFILTVG